MLPEWMHPDWDLMCQALTVGLLMDIVYPEHRGLLLKIHPVVLAFKAARALAPPYASTIRGAAASLAVLMSALAPVLAALYVSWGIGPTVWVLVAGVIVKLSIPVRLLIETVWRSSVLLAEGRLGEARRLVQGIVRRDVGRLGGGHVASAAIESLSESLVDAILGPLFWYIILGPVGAFMQRIINTLDGALGFKTPDYIRAGKLAAWLDTMVNLVPARITALEAILLSKLAGLDMGRAFRTWRDFRGVTDSLNAGHPIAAYAGALGVVLEKPGSYRIGEGRLPGPGDIRKAVGLALLQVAASYIITCTLLAVLG